jgi:hypothetical protein
MRNIQIMFHDYLEVFFVTNTANATPAANASSAGDKQIILKEVSAKWGKFSEQDLSSLKGKDDLVTQIVAKYSTDKAQVQREVDTLLNGRAF